MPGKPETANPFTLERDSENNLQASNALNEFYTSVNADIPPLDVNLLPLIVYLQLNVIKSVRNSNLSTLLKPPDLTSDLSMLTC